MQSSGPDASRYWCYGLLLLVILFFALIRFHLRACPLERDEGEYAYAGQLILQGIPPYQLVYSMKLPGTFAAYSLILAAFGQTPAAVHIGLLLISALTTVFVFVLARRLFDPLAGLIAGASYALLSTSPSVVGLAGHATHFVVLAAVPGILLLLRAIESRRIGLFFWSGVLLGLAFLMKQPGILFAILGGVYLVRSEYREGRIEWRDLTQRVLAFALGVVLPFAVTCLAFFATGNFPKFWFWTFTYAHEYASVIGITEGLHLFRLTTAQVIRPALWIWAIAAVGLTAPLWNRQARAHQFFPLTFFIFSCLAICPGLYFRRHYFILLLPAIALLAGVAVSSARRKLLTGGRKAWAFAPVLIFVLALADAIFVQREYLFEADPLAACRALYGNNPFPEAVEVGEYLKSHAPPGARIAVLGSEPEIYFYSRRHSATGYIYTYSLMEPHQHALAMQREMIRDIEGARPEFVVFVNVPASFGRLPTSETLILSWADNYLQGYDKIGTVDIDDPTNYIWGEAAANYQPRSQSFINVFERKQAAD